MTFFVPMGQGTVNEHGSELITNPGSGITKAGWGGSRVRFRPPGDSDSGDSGGGGGSCKGGSCGCTLPSCGCTPKILANNEELPFWTKEDLSGKDVNFELDLSGCAGNDYTYQWRFYYGRNLGVFQVSTDAQPTHTYFEALGEPYLVTVSAQCIGCNALNFSFGGAIIVYRPKIVIKIDEDIPFELIDRGGIGTSYFEKTNLVIEAQYPNGHPNANQVMTDFSGTVEITENEETDYYNDAVFNTFLPVEIEFVNGKVEKSLNSISNVSHPSISQPTPATIEIEVTGLESPWFGSIMTVEVEQWVLSSDLTFNGMNNPLIADWFEKAIWSIIEHFKLNPDSDIASEVILGVDGILAATDRINIESTCAYVKSSDHLNLNFKTSCHNQRDIFRLNDGKNLEMIVMHESRHVWQNIQMRLEPVGVVRIGDEEFANDSDGDRCPEIVGAGSEAGLSDSTPIQDGTGNTESSIPDSIPDNYGTEGIFQECSILREADASEFGATHD